MPCAFESPPWLPSSLFQPLYQPQAGRTGIMMCSQVRFFWWVFLDCTDSLQWFRGKPQWTPWIGKDSILGRALDPVFLLGRVSEGSWLFDFFVVAQHRFVLAGVCIVANKMRWCYLPPRCPSSHCPLLRLRMLSPCLASEGLFSVSCP